MSSKVGGAGGAKQPATATKKKNNAKQVKPLVMGKGTPPEVQAQIFALLVSGQFHHDSDLAKHLNISKGTVTKYKKMIPPDVLEQVRAVKKERVGELIVKFLEETLESLSMMNAALTPDWYVKQDAPGLAIFFGVKVDKVAKILDSINRADDAAGVISASEGS